MNRNSKQIILAIVVLLILVGGSAAHLHNKTTPEQQQATDNVRTLMAVQKLLIVPQEQPIIATINQADLLVKEQAFYAGSANGDKLLIFPALKKAIIYSPSRNVIVNAGPFVINNDTTPVSPSKAITP